MSVSLLTVPGAVFACWSACIIFNDDALGMLASMHMVQAFSSPPLRLDLPGCAPDSGQTQFSISKKYSVQFVWSQLISWTKTSADPYFSLSSESSGALSLPDIEGLYDKHYSAQVGTPVQYAWCTLHTCFARDITQQ